MCTFNSRDVALHHLYAFIRNKKALNMLRCHRFILSTCRSINIHYIAYQGFTICSFPFREESGGHKPLASKRRGADSKWLARGKGRIVRHWLAKI